MAKLCDKVLCKIKEEKITPRPRWQFLLKNYFVWTVFAFSVAVGAISFCVILDFLADNDLDVYRYAVENPIETIVISLPVVWIIALLFFLWLAYYNYKHTREGYRHETYAIFGLSIVASIVLGSFLHFALGAGEKVEGFLADNLPFYEKINSHCSNKEIWLQPEKGLLVGSIIGMPALKGFILKDPNDVVWEIEKNEGVIIRGKAPLYENEEVKIIGDREDDRVFHAIEIRPWKKGCQTRKKDKD